jgi:ABC-type sugar transport systems, ATPase components
MTLSASFALPLRSFVLDLELEVEGTVALIGPSGAGKTSVLSAVAGLSKPASGGSPSTATSGSTRRTASSGSRTSGASASSSRNTRCSRT